MELELSAASARPVRFGLRTRRRGRELKREFRLTVLPNPATIKVDILATCSTLPAALAFCTSTTNNCSDASPSIDCVPPAAGAPASGWSYDPNTNSIVFSGSALPPRGSDIEVTYGLPDAGVAQ